MLIDSSYIIFFATAIAVLQIMPVLAQWQEKGGEYLHLDEAFLVPMALLLSPLSASTVFILAVLVAGIMQQRTWYKVLFNAAQMGFSAGGGVWLAREIGGLDGAVIGALLYTILTALFVSLVRMFVESVPFTYSLTNQVPLRVVMSLSAIILGVAMITSITDHPEIFPPVAMAVVGAQVWYSRSTQPEIGIVSVYG